MMTVLSQEQADAIKSALPTEPMAPDVTGLARTVDAAMAGIDNIAGIREDQRTALKADLVRRAEAAGIRQETDAEQNQREALARFRIDPAPTERTIADLRAQATAAKTFEAKANYLAAADQLQAGLDRYLAARTAAVSP